MRISFHRILGLLAALAIAGAAPANANGVSSSISNGQTKTGLVSGAGSDSYAFTATEGATYMAAVSETGDHDSHFIPRVELIPPGEISGASLAQALHTEVLQTNAAAGKWTVRVSRMDADQSSGGSYSLKLVQTGSGSTAMTAGRSYSGSNTRGEPATYTFSGTAGTTRLKVSATAGEGYQPMATVFAPSGEEAGWLYCDTECSVDVKLPADGTYTVVIDRHDTTDVTGSYTLTVGGND